MDSVEGNVEVDIESGSVEPGRSIQTVSESFGDKTVSECDTILTKTCGRLLNFDGIRGEGSEESSGFIPKSGEFTCEDALIVLDRNSGTECCNHLASEGKGCPKDNRFKPYSNKHCKPPRPPKGPVLNASDMLLVREISELAAKKRQKIEKTRALKKMKAAKGSSSGASVIAMVITIVFFIIIVLQGVYSRGGIQPGFQGSPAPSVSNKGLISVRFYSKPPENEMSRGAIDHYPNSEEPASGSLPQVEEGRDIQ